MDLTAAEIRVLGCLIEKQRTTPDTYPLTLNALRVACNQSTARDPVVRYDDAVVRDAMTRLSRRRWARLAGGGRAPKFRHLLDEALTRAPDELAVLCVLMLRGPQTPGELKQRTDRLHPFADLAAIHETLRRLIDRELVMQLERRPGQKEERFAQRLGEDADELVPSPHAYEPPPPRPAAAPSQPREAFVPPPAPAAPDPAIALRLTELERQVEELQAAGAAAARPEAVSAAEPAASPDPEPTADPLLEPRVTAIEQQVAELRAELRALLDML